MTKSDPKDPLLRSLTLLSLIPRYPKSASVQELRTTLTAGFVDSGHSGEFG